MREQQREQWQVGEKVEVQIEKGVWVPARINTLGGTWVTLDLKTHTGDIVRNYSDIRKMK